jgi:hypothetical protein
MVTKYPKWSQNIPNGHKIFQMAMKYIKNFNLRSSKIDPKWDFWFKNKQSGNPGLQSALLANRQWPHFLHFQSGAANIVASSAFSRKKAVESVGLPDFSWFNVPKRENLPNYRKIYVQDSHNTKWHKMYQVTIKFTIWDFGTFANIPSGNPDLGSFVEKRSNYERR